MTDLHAAARSGAVLWTKVDVIHHLAAARGYRSYLEFCSVTTGHRYADIDRRRFDRCHRLMYNCPEDFSDGLAVDFRSADLDIAACLGAMQRQRLRYDIILVDPFHLYDTSRRDLAAAFDFVADGGTVVVHDCRPPREEIAGPDYRAGEWCGVTYKAYVDFVAGGELRYLTVDADYGCGVIFAGRPRWWWRLAAPLLPASRRQRQLIEGWRACGADYGRAYAYLERNDRALLNLVSVETFMRTEAGRGVRRP
jgi:hypothetical protein